MDLGFGPNFDSLSPRQQQCVELLAAGLGPVAVCQRTGVGRGVLYRWRQLPEFQGAIADILTSQHEAALVELRGAVGEAVATIRDAIRDPECPPSVRVPAAFKLIELMGGARILEVQAAADQQATAAAKQAEIKEALANANWQLWGIGDPPKELKLLDRETLNDVRLNMGLDPLTEGAYLASLIELNEKWRAAHPTAAHPTIEAAADPPALPPSHDVPAHPG